MTRISMLTCALALGLTGCGTGYNRVLFLARSNVGLEASTLPPTLELDINRLEGVVAPQFENGKKMPVMASFKYGSESMFSPAVGSTFATGDAAMTMASLYNDELPVSSWRDRVQLVKGKTPGGYPADSTLVLEKEPTIDDPPWWRAWFTPRRTFQKTDVRPVFFGTDTSFGLKIAWSGMTNVIPDSVRLGFNRKELAIVPITMEEDDDGYKMRMASLLATIDNSVEVGSPRDTKVSYLQYFATGDAATLLALQPSVRQAMLKRLDPEAAEAAQGLKSSPPRVRGFLLFSMKATLQGVAGAPTLDRYAGAHLKALDGVALAIGVPDNYSKSNPRYTFTKANVTLKIDPKPRDTRLGALNVNFDALLGYRTQLLENDLEIAKALSATTPVTVDPTTTTPLKDLKKANETKLADLEHALSENAAMQNAWTYYVELISN